MLGLIPRTPAARVRVLRRGPERGIPLTCLQCHDAACVAACPVTALVRDPATGAVRLLDARCVRCGLCVAACPFGNMVPETDAPPAKCDLCGGTPPLRPLLPHRRPRVPSPPTPPARAFTPAALTNSPRPESTSEDNLADAEAHAFQPHKTLPVSTNSLPVQQVFQNVATELVR